jgi:hypothetical protein
MFPLIQSIHLIGIALLVGSIVLIDLRLLSYVLSGYTVSETVRRLAPWTRIGLAMMLITGPILFASNVNRYSQNPAFLVKMGVLAVTLLFHFTAQKHTEQRPKLVAIVSIVLWTCVVLGGRAIADFDI